MLCTSPWRARGSGLLSPSMAPNQSQSLHPPSKAFARADCGHAWMCSPRPPARSWSHSTDDELAEPSDNLVSADRYGQHQPRTIFERTRLLRTMLGSVLELTPAPPSQPPVEQDVFQDLQPSPPTHVNPITVTGPPDELHRSASDQGYNYEMSVPTLLSITTR